ncbi:hypothetical protein [Streptomyces sp. LN499]|uniref:hypothetical protein n=1 Tax=Streptomyces sp. LN499 TaxID=3112977 RepID=UPI00371F8F96
MQRAPAARYAARGGEGTAQRAGRGGDDHQQPGQRAEADQPGRATHTEAERYEGAEQRHMPERDLHGDVQEQEAERGGGSCPVDALAEQALPRGQEQPVGGDQAPGHRGGERDQ